MSEQKFERGWLRQEIESAINDLVSKPYLTDEQRQSFRRALQSLKQSDRLAS